MNIPPLIKKAPPIQSAKIEIKRGRKNPAACPSLARMPTRPALFSSVCVTFASAVNKLLLCTLCSPPQCYFFIFYFFPLCFVFLLQILLEELNKSPRLLIKLFWYQYCLFWALCTHSSLCLECSPLYIYMGWFPFLLLSLCLHDICTVRNCLKTLFKLQHTHRHFTFLYPSNYYIFFSVSLNSFCSFCLLFLKYGSSEDYICNIYTLC